ncbi:hypothetical protein ACPPVU_12505 [Mucilaginibacter sp. McL0603]|uniref:hypothetical protein n=1 Tax=Mucilaginibacter sp. McL0603 TaxID=3415670 RepID=UPI003CEC83E8
MLPEWKDISRSFDFRSINLTDNGKDGWAVGQGTIWHYRLGADNKGHWQDETPAEIKTDRRYPSSVAVQQDGNAWAVGPGMIWHYSPGADNKGHWQDETPPEIKKTNLSSVVVQHDGNAWAVGIGTILHYSLGADNKGHWRDETPAEIKKAQTVLYSIAVQQDGNAWAVGDGTIWHYRFGSDNKGHWQDETPDTIKRARTNLLSVTAQQNGNAWAVTDGAIWHYTPGANNHGQWKDETPVEIKNSLTVLNSVAVQQNGNAWAVGRETIWHYSLGADNKGHWQDETPTEIKTAQIDLSSVAVQQDGNAWAVSFGRIWHYSLGADNKGHWQEETQGEIKIAQAVLSSVAVQRDDNAWAVGGGTILHYSLGADNKGHWQDETPAEIKKAQIDLSSVAVQQDGNAWAVGRGTILHYGLGADNKGHWQDETPDTIKRARTQLLSVAVQQDGNAWAVGRGTILHYSLGADNKGHWQDETPDTIKRARTQLLSVAVQQDGNAWAVGSNMIWHYTPEADNKGHWQDETPDTIKRVQTTLSSVAVQQDGNAWVVGSHMILHYTPGADNKGRWQDETPAEINRTFLQSVAVQQDGNAWAVGDGTVWYYNPNNLGKWYRDLELLSFPSSSVAIKPNGGAWVVGIGIVEGSSIPITLFSLKTVDYDNLKTLQGSIKLKTNAPLYDVTLDLHPEKDTLVHLLSQRRYTKHRNEDGSITIKFRDDAKNVLQDWQGKYLKIKVSVKIHPSLSIWNNYESNNFRLDKEEIWIIILRNSIIVGLSIFVLNFLLLLLAIPLPWFRKNIFGENFDLLLSIFSVKGIITKPLLIWIQPIKQAILKNYKMEILKRPDLLQWSIGRKKYNPPQVEEVDSGHLIENLWNKIKSKKNNNLWLIEGRSGLGKTALLEQLTIEALTVNKTPILLKLGLFQNGGMSLQSEFQRYGQLEVDEKTALSIVKNGNFIILLDGLNECRDQENVRSFVKLVLRENIVIITSQFTPDWPEIQKEKIDLRPFGKQQLQFLLKNDAWVDSIQRAEYLFDFYSNDQVRNDFNFLPFTTTLIAEYIVNNNGNLPITRLTIYKELIEKLKDELQFINLKKKAWSMFCENSQNLEPDNSVDNIDSQFLETAKNEKVLTVYIVQGKKYYRFIHERIFRFIVTYHLYGQNKFPDMEELHNKLNNGQDKLYWVDVIEFWGEFLSEDANTLSAGTNKYKDFLVEIGSFEPLILKKRLIYQWKRLKSKHPELIDREFEDKLLLILAQEGEEI